MGSATTGVLDNDNNREDWWTHTSSLRRTFTLQQSGGNAIMWVGNQACDVTLCNDYSYAAVKSCSTTVTGPVNVMVHWFSENGADIVSYTLTVTESNFQCSDGSDNDGDGRVDYPSDPGCGSSADDSESPDPQCGDQVDNDGDGRTDYPSDPGCTSIGDTSESPDPPQCADGLDNDADGKTDWPTDPGCSTSSDNSESPDPQCVDGVDNDGDGKVDYPADPGCTSSTDNTESPNPQCVDGVDNDGDGWVDHPADPGCSSPTDNSESPNPQCSDGVDNDGDGKVDYPTDPGCTSIFDVKEGCDSLAPSPVVACISPSTVFQRVTAQQPEVDPGVTHRIAGHVDVYRFELPNGATVSLPCVTLAVDGTGANPCADAGGTFVSRTLTLVDQTVTEPVPGSGGTLVDVAICNAELTVTVAGVGVNSMPAYALC